MLKSKARNQDLRPKVKDTRIDKEIRWIELKTGYVKLNGQRLQVFTPDSRLETLGFRLSPLII